MNGEGGDYSNKSGVGGSQNSNLNQKPEFVQFGWVSDGDAFAGRHVETTITTGTTPRTSRAHDYFTE